MTLLSMIQFEPHVLSKVSTCRGQFASWCHSRLETKWHISMNRALILALKKIKELFLVTMIGSRDSLQWPAEGLSLQTRKKHKEKGGMRYSHPPRLTINRSPLCR